MKTVIGFLVLGLLIVIYYVNFIRPLPQPQSQFFLSQQRTNAALALPYIPLYALLRPVSPPVLLDAQSQPQNSSLTVFKAQYIALTNHLLKHPSSMNPQSIHYWVDYTVDCHYKKIPLKNAILTVKVYYNGNPMGLIDITTDNLQHFAFDNEKFKETSLVSLEVLDVKAQTQQEYHARCYGYVRPGHTELLINCDELKQQG